MTLLGVGVAVLLGFSVLTLGAGTSVVVTVPEANAPLSDAINSVIRFAQERVNEEGVLTGNNTLKVSTAAVAKEHGLAAVADLCLALDGHNDTVAVVSNLGTRSTSSIASLSNSYLDLPILSVGGAGARSDSQGDGTEAGAGYLVHVQPAIMPQMEALVRLILDMKLARDAVDGRSEITERVWVAHTSDTYGTAAVAAFNVAANVITVALPAGGSASGLTDDDGGGAALRASVEVAGTFVLPASSDASFASELTVLLDQQASIVVLLAEGYDGAIIRAVLTQANDAGLVSQGVQWYLPDAAAFDHIFDHNSTYRDASLAFDMRGTLGVRSCMPRTGDGSGVAESLTAEWVLLDPNEYPGAGPNGVTADGQIEPFLAFAYDAVFLAAATAQVAQDTVSLAGRDLTGIELDSCPFPENPWLDGAVMRNSILAASADLIGATGPLRMSIGEEDIVRDMDTTTYCAFNLRPDASQGARFEVISTVNGGTLEAEDGQGFQAIGQFLEPQTFPRGASTYPPDRPILQGRHLDVVMRRDAPPFVFVKGDGLSISDYTGITPEFLKALSENAGFTYSLRAPPSGTTTVETIEMVRNGSAEMTGSWITITAERSEFVSFTYPYFDLRIAFVYKPLIFRGLDLLKAFAPFEPGLWLALLLALLVTVFLLWLFEGAKNDEFSRGGWDRRHRNFTRGFSRSVYVTSSLMMSQLTHKPETLEGYLLTTGWLFTSFVLAASYTAELASFLTATRTMTTNLSIEGLKNGEIPHSNVALLQGGNTQFLYERDFQRCGTPQECSQGDTPQPCYSTAECFDMVMNGTALTALADSATAEYELMNDFCGLTTLPQELYPQHYGFVVPLDSELVKDFQTATLNLREDGTLSSIIDNYLRPTQICAPASTDNGNDTNLTVADVSGVFVVLAFFLAISTISWCFRRSPWAKRSRARRQERLRTQDSDIERSVFENYAKMSRRQQKAFAMQATVSLLQNSREVNAASKILLNARRGDSKDPGGDGDPRGDRKGSDGAPGDPKGTTVRRKKPFQDEIASGRPVVTLGGGGEDSSNHSWPSRSASTSSLLFRRVPSQQPLSHQRDNSSASHRRDGSHVGANRMMSFNRGRSGGGFSTLGSSSGFLPTPPKQPAADDEVSPLPAANKGGLAVRSAASKWLARRGGNGGKGREGRGGGACRRGGVQYAGSNDNGMAAAAAEAAATVDVADNNSTAVDEKEETGAAIASTVGCSSDRSWRFSSDDGAGAMSDALVGAAEALAGAAAAAEGRQSAAGSLRSDESDTEGKE